MRFRARQITHRELILGSEKYPDPDPIMVTWAISRQIAVTPDLNLTVTPPIFSNRAVLEICQITRRDLTFKILKKDPDSDTDQGQQTGLNIKERRQKANW
jgi:hypothetical protein